VKLFVPKSLYLLFLYALIVFDYKNYLENICNFPYIFDLKQKQEEIQFFQYQQVILYFQLKVILFVQVLDN
jgi:hypothetical protein